MVRVLTWNLKHGRAVPSAGRDLFDEFAAALARWRWDVALLQEVPPWWPAPLAARLHAEQRSALTSRNAGLPVRRFIATRRPDLIKSNGGGANAILVRERSILEHRVQRLSWLPERRWVHAVRLEHLWVANLHLQGTDGQARRAGAAALAWAGGDALVLGGDFNLRAVPLAELGLAAAHGVDQILVRGLHAAGDPEIPDRGRLSDHAPVVVALTRRPRSP